MRSERADRAIRMLGDDAPDALALIDSARRALAEAQTVTQAAALLAEADIAAYLARRMKAEEAQKIANELRLRAERRIGELLAVDVTRGYKSLPDGVGRMDSSRWQRLAQIPPDDFEEALRGNDPSTASLLRLWARQRRGPEPTCTVADLGKLAERPARFGTIYADPPWQYGNQGTRAATDNHYPTMGVEQIKALPVVQLAADDAHLWLWTTVGFQEQTYGIMRAWGFEPKSALVWCKPQMGIGNYLRLSHEVCLFGLRGDAPFADRAIQSWFTADRTEHSRKPEAARLFIERASPGPRLELFGRRAADGWTVWGNEVERDLLTQNAEAV